MSKLRKFVIWYLENECLSFTEGYSEDIVEAVSMFLEGGHDAKSIISVYTPLEGRDSL